MELTDFKAKIEQFIDFDDSEDSAAHLVKGKKLTPEMLAGWLWDLATEIEDNAVSDDEFKAHYHVDTPSIKHEVKVR